MSKQKQYRALIIGAGKIASGFDTPTSKAILTHAHAYRQHPRTSLIGFCDTDSATAHKAARKWSTSTFTSLEQALSLGKPDIISVCTPDATHAQILKQLARDKHKPRIVICEKPLTNKMSQGKKIVDLYRLKRIPLLIDHSRRFDRTVQDVASRLREGTYGQVICASAMYGKGILHSGTHIIDLARYFFGEVKTHRVLYRFFDRANHDDPTLGGFMTYERCPQMYLNAGDGRAYDYFQFDIVCTKRRIVFTDLGFTMIQQRVVSDPVFKGYRILGKSVITTTDFKNALLRLVENAVGHIEHHEPLICSGSDALRTQSVCLEMKKQLVY